MSPGFSAVWLSVSHSRRETLESVAGVCLLACVCVLPLPPQPGLDNGKLARLDGGFVSARQAAARGCEQSKQVDYLRATGQHYDCCAELAAS